MTQSLGELWERHEKSSRTDSLLLNGSRNHHSLAYDTVLPQSTAGDVITSRSCAKKESGNDNEELKNQLAHGYSFARRAETRGERARRMFSLCCTLSKPSELGSESLFIAILLLTSL